MTRALTRAALTRRTRPFAAALLLTVSVGGAVVAAQPAGAAADRARTPTCNHRRATIVVTGNHKTVNGTGKADVIVALGSGDVVRGYGGNDTICVRSAKSVDGGSGNDYVSFAGGTISGSSGDDTLVQTGAGKAVVLGGTGNDRITLAGGNASVDGGPGNDTITSGTSGIETLLGSAGNDTITARGATARIDGGQGLDAIVVPPAFAARTVVVPGSGDLLNGTPLPVNAGPATTYDISFGGRPLTNPAGQTLITTASDVGRSSYLFINRVLPAIGRTIAAWKVDFGDGSIVLGGTGSPPDAIAHAYLADGARTISVLLTDSSGATTARNLAVNAAHQDSLGLADVKGPSTAPLTITPTYTVGTGAVPVGFVYDFGDGTTQNGAGAPVAVQHSYPPGYYSVSLTVLNDHGIASSRNALATVTDDGTGKPSATLGLTVEVPLVLGGVVVPGTSVTAPATQVAVGQLLSVGVSRDNADLASLDLGDGRGPQTDASTSVGASYNTPGVKTISAVIKPFSAGMPAYTISKTVTVFAGAVRAELDAPDTTPEGVVAISTVGTSSPPGTFWSIASSDAPTVYGSGPVPPLLTRTLPAGREGLTLTLVNPDGETSTASRSIAVTGPRAVVTDIAAGDTQQFNSTGTGYGAAGVDAVQFTGHALASAGHHLVTGTLAFGDGSVLVDPPGLRSGSLAGTSAGPLLGHTYATAGTYTAVLTAVDDGGQTASRSVTVQVGTEPTVVAAVTPGTKGGPATLALTGYLAGANTSPLSYRIDFGDAYYGSSSPTNPSVVSGYGAPPAAFTHVYPTGVELTAEITVTNDHGLSYTTDVDVPPGS